MVKVYVICKTEYGDNVWHEISSMDSRKWEIGVFGLKAVSFSTLDLEGEPIGIAWKEERG